MNFDDPRDLGLLQFGLGMLQASGPRPYRQTFGAGLAEGAQHGLKAYALQKELLDKQKERSIINELRLAQAERQKKLAAQGTHPDDSERIRSAAAYRASWNEKHPDKPMSLYEAMDITMRAPQSFMGMPLKMGTNGDWLFPENLPDFFGSARNLEQNKSIGSTIGKAMVTADTVLDANNRPSYKLQSDTIREQYGGKFPWEQTPPPVGQGKPTALDPFLPNEAPPALRAAIEADNARRGGQPATRPFNAADPEIVRAGAQARKEGEQDAEKTKQANDFSRILPELYKIEQLIPKATGSGFGALVDKAGNFVGVSTEGSEVNAAIAPYAGRVLNMVPRFEGPQSDGDREEYRKQAGKLADETLPPGQKLSALKSIRDIASRYKYPHGTRRQGADGRWGVWDTTVGKWRIE